MRRGREYKYLVTNEKKLAGILVFLLVYALELGGFGPSDSMIDTNITGPQRTGCTG